MLFFHIENTDYMPLTWNFTFSSSSPALLCVAVTTVENSDVETVEKNFSVVVELATKPDLLITVEPSTTQITISNDDCMYNYLVL